MARTLMDMLSGLVVKSPVCRETRAWELLTLYYKMRIDRGDKHQLVSYDRIRHTHTWKHFMRLSEALDRQKVDPAAFLTAVFGACAEWRDWP